MWTLSWTTLSTLHYASLLLLVSVQAAPAAAAGHLPTSTSLFGDDDE
jgi:hypothetical protein